MIAEGGFDGLGFGDVAERRAGAVGVDVLHVLGIDVGVAQGELHGHGRAGAFGVRGGDVVCVGGVADAQEFGVDRGVAFLGVFEFFQNQGPGPFAQNEAVAILVEGTAGGLRDLSLRCGQALRAR